MKGSTTIEKTEEEEQEDEDFDQMLQIIESRESKTALDQVTPISGIIKESSTTPMSPISITHNWLKLWLDYSRSYNQAYINAEFNYYIYYQDIYSF